MPLILAIEPDRRQASRITALARNPLNVELIVTDSAERAVAAIAQRVPDLILTPKLLSSKDESILDARLRELDADGRHVQTLMIPMLASARSSGKKESGLLNRLRWSSEEDSSDGCDPAVFAAEIAQYLERAAAERAVKAAHEHDRAFHQQAVAPEHEPGVEAQRQAADEADAIESPQASADVRAAEPAPTEHEPAPLRDGPRQDDGHDSSDDVVAPPEDVAAFVNHLEAELGSDAAAHAPDAADANLPVRAADELVAEFAFDTEPWTPVPAGQPDQAPLHGTASKAFNPGPDDEWGFFDPDRVGFAALLAKLQEVTE